MLQIYVLGCVISTFIHLKKRSNFKLWLISKERDIAELVPQCGLKLFYDSIEQKLTLRQGKKSNFESIYKSCFKFPFASILLSWVFVIKLLIDGAYRIPLDVELYTLLDRLKDCDSNSIASLSRLQTYLLSKANDTSEVDQILKEKLYVVSKKYINNYNIDLVEAVYFWMLLTRGDLFFGSYLKSKNVISFEYYGYLKIWELILNIDMTSEERNQTKVSPYSFFYLTLKNQFETGLENISKYLGTSFGRLTKEEISEIFDDEAENSDVKYHEALFQLVTKPFENHEAELLCKDYLKDKCVSFDDFQNFYLKYCVDIKDSFEHSMIIG